MKICFIIDNIFPSYGGMSKTIERFSKALKDKGHQIIFITAKREAQEDIESIEGVNVYRIKSLKIPFTGDKYYAAFPSISNIKDILMKEEINVIHLISYTSLGIKSIKAANELKIPLVYGLHIQPENVTKPISLDFKIINDIVIKRLKKMCESCYSTITPSKFSKRLMKDYGIRNKVFIISNGVDLNVFNRNHISDKLFRDKFNLDDKRFFLFVGRIMTEKNLGVIIDACKKIDWNLDINKDLVFVIIGDGVDRIKLQEEVIKNNLQDKIIFTGRLDDSLLKSAYKGCEVLVHPSLVELEGMTLLEAMAFAKPLIVADSKTSASPSLVSGNGYLFEPHNSDELAEKMISLINDKRILQRFGETSLRKAKNFFSFEKSLEKMENVFSEAINESKQKE